jgi:pyruvate dehydrogenase (quinone)
MFLGNPEYECDLQPIDFAKVAEGMGFKSFRIEMPSECSRVLESALKHNGPALVEATVDPNEPLLPPKRIEKYARNLEQALQNGTKGSSQIRAALSREPYATQMHS